MALHLFVTLLPRLPTKFSLALEIMNWGIALFEDNHWREQYDLSLALYNGACKISYLDGDFEQVGAQLMGAIKKHGRMFHHKLNAQVIHMSALSSTPSSMVRLLESASSYLEELNVKPLLSVGQPSKVPVRLILEVRKVKRLTKSPSNWKIMPLSAMSDPDHLVTKQIMNMTITLPIQTWPYVLLFK
jgi:hypothetical protein